MGKTSNRYTDDFKKMIVEVYETGKPIKEICEEYGVTYSSASTWIQKVYPKEKISSKPLIKESKKQKNSSKEEKDEIMRLKKENERIALENEILKKAIAIFSKDQNI
ncbi:transposase [Clostridium folliculivorans]|uniref:Transposase n=1 Tax=Clostridium folliculivorans TaxID=2886038 RepID=A0A9W5Y0F6_9CLOT|nr:transposase [Clostridium folliculivorans]